MPECVRMTGARDCATICLVASSDECEASINTPSRFASVTNSRPAGDRPFHSGGAVALSARSLFEV